MDSKKDKKMNKDKQLLDKIDINKIPVHVAIIMDGNGRWAYKRGLPRYAGHKAGVEALKRTIKACLEIKIKYLTVFAFSTENWKRPLEEVSVLMKLLSQHLVLERNDLHNNGVKVCFLGELKKLSKEAQEKISSIQELTQDNDKLVFNIALNYGGRLEIIDAVKKITKDVLDGELEVEEINDKIFAHYLYTKDIPDPDLLIRPSGEIRLSNFLLWQTAYTELYISSVLWPDFEKADLFEALIDYQSRDRRFGGITK